MLLSVYGIFTLLYVIINFLLLRGWRGWPLKISKSKIVKRYVSVIITVRNEEKNIVNILGDLERQNYNRFEVIVVNDHSEDKTKELVQNFNSQSKINVSIFDLSNLSKSPKKDAITLGVELSNGDLIVSTDADCRVGENWIASIAGHFEGELKFLAGPVTFNNQNSIFRKIQTIEFASLIGSGAAALYFKKPIMC